VSYLILLIVAALPIYNVGSKYGMTLVTGVLGVLIFFAIYAGLYWVGGKLNRKPS
jgi:high-affinity Fe2+/Pb2+ permease